MEPQLKLNSLPAPRPGTAGRMKLIIPAVLAVIALGCAVFWLTRSDDDKKELAGKTESLLQDAGLAPLVDAGKKLVSPPPPPPLHSVGTAAPGVSANGTLIQGTLASPADLEAAAAAQAVNGQQEPAPPGVAPKLREDSVIRADFVRDLAGWMVSRYKPAPAGGRGQINAGLQAANLRYGTNLRGMERKSAGDIPASRAFILRYAFSPSMLEALYGIYAERFVDEVAHAALAPDQGKAMSEAQLDDLYANYAGFFGDLSKVTAGAAAMPDLKARIEQVNAVGRKSLAVHAEITETVFALDEAREKGNTASVQNLEKKLAELNGRYRSALQEHNAARAALIAAIRKGAPVRHLDDDTVLFVTLWIERRLDQPDAQAAAVKASQLLADLSRRFEAAAGKAPKTPKTP